MAELPTEEELEKLYHEKGHDALVWYAWRNALRVLPLFQLGIAWRRNTVVRYAYMVCRPSLVLAQWANILTEVKFFDTQSAAEAIAYAETDDFHNSTAASAAVNAVNTAVNTAANTCAASAVAAAANAANLYYDASLAITDYTFLLHNNKSSVAFWYSQPLWTGDDDRTVIAKWRQSFDSDLRELGLDFLADDLNNLWEGKPLGTHAKNYLQDLSETITNDPERLRRAILFGETTENIHAVRVLLLGAGGAGKSSLADRLRGKMVEQVKPLTIGVDYLQHQSLNLQEIFPDFGLDGKELDLFLWDFGGQTIFHGLHSAFLHENCVYVLVVDSRHEQAPDEWLHQIRHLAGSHAKVLLVTNWYEQCETYQNKIRLLREFPDLLTDESFFYFSCLDKDEPDFKRFVQSLVKASLDSQKMVLKETLDVQRALDAQYKDGDTVFVRESKLRELIAANIQDAKNTDSTLNQLQQLGFLVQVEKGNSRYCLKPAWVVDNAYQLLYSPILRQANGILKLTALEQVFAGKVDEDHVEYLVSFLNERSLCIRLQDNGKYFFPDATRADEPPLVGELLNQQNKLILHFDVPYLPLGFHARLVHKLFVPHSEVGIHNPQDIWRQGFILRAGTTSQAIVHYLLRKNVIEMVLTGDLKAFSTLLREFYTHLKAVLMSPNGIRLEQIHPSVLFNQQSFSVHSGEGLLNVLEQINSYDQLFQEVKNLSAKQVFNIEKITGGNNSFGRDQYNGSEPPPSPESEKSEKWYDKHWWAICFIPSGVIMLLSGFLGWKWSDGNVLLGETIAAICGALVYLILFLNNPKRRFFRAASLSLISSILGASSWFTGKWGYISSDEKTRIALEVGVPMDMILSLSLFCLAGFLFYLDSKQK
jgi:GTPase SAR1 family protein